MTESDPIFDLLDSALSSLRQARVVLHNPDDMAMHDELYEAERHVRYVKLKILAAAFRAQREEGQP